MEASVLMLAGMAAAALMTAIQLSPLKLDPWSALAKAIGRALNAEMLAQLAETRAALDRHIQMDDERAADGYRGKILAFNTELLRGEDHTREDFIEILAEVDRYEKYCRSHPDYKNSRAVHAVANIGRVYDQRLQKQDFLGELKPRGEGRKE